MPGKLRSSLNIVRLELGVILEIDFENQTYFVRTEMSELPSYRIPIMSPYLDSNGIGMKMCATVGTTCIVALLSDQTRCILGFIPVADSNGNMDSGFNNMTSGDMFFQGKSDNFLRIRSGGIVEIGATPIASTIYIPIRNIIHNIAENFIIDTLAGSLEYKVERAEDDSNGHQKCSFNFTVKEFTDDENDLVRFKAGSVSDSLALSLKIKDSGNGENTNINIELKKEGTLNMSLSKDMSFNLKGNLSLAAEQDVTIQSKNNTSITTNKNMDLKGLNVTISGNTNITLKSQTIDIKGSNVNISNNALFPVVRLSPDLATLLSAVSALAMVPLSGLHFNPTVKT